MYQKYQDGLINAINAITTVAIKAEQYFGELEKPQEGNFLKGSLPIIYIDFIQDDTSKPTTIDIEFSLYIVHIAYSKNKATRITARTEIHELLKAVYKQLAFKPIEDSEPIEFKKLRKIYDASTAGGYVTIYQKEILLSVPNPILKGEF
ncbi:MAG: hypothetical protein GQ570_10350 [Helicobacteraceae bacterium]|nr:hypothetical protein [Helicobacteraceae bacterium]